MNINTIVSHEFTQQYHNNAQLYNESPKSIGVISFHDFSYAGYDERTGKGDAKPVAGTIMTIVSKRYITAALDALNSPDPEVKKGFDQMNKLMSMMWINWNGAEITHGNWATGGSTIISTTPEFLLLFDNVVTAGYEYYKETNIANRIVRSKSKVVNINSNVSNLTPGDPTFGDHEVWDIIYENTDQNNEYTITYVNNTTISSNELSGNVKFKVPGGSENLVIVVPPGGYGEVSFLRIGSNIYVRGV